MSTGDTEPGVVGPRTVLGARWPFVGRRRELAVALDELADPESAGVFIVGPAGVGKTRLLDEMAARLTAQGRVVNRVVGAEATRAIPFAAIAHALPPDVFAADRAPDPLRIFDSVRRLATSVLGPGERFITIVDDIVQLDDASLALLTQLITARIAAVAATVRSGILLPPVLASIERSHQVARVEMDELDEPGVAELLETALAGPVDRQTVRSLATVSQGNTLYLRELVQSGLDRGALVVERGHWRLSAPLSTTSRLVEAVTGRLDGLPDDARELSEILAVAEPLSIDDLDAAGLGDAALALDAVGLVSASDVGGATVVRLSHPLYGEVLRSQLTVLRRRHLLLRAADAVGAAGRPDDALRLATWLTSAGAEVDPEVLRRGTQRARAANDFPLTEQLARAACAQGADLDMLLLLGEALHELGRFDEADAVLATAGPFVGNDLDRLRVAVMHHRVRLWGALDGDASLAVLEAAADGMEPGTLRSLLFLAMANTLAFDGRPREALAAVDRCEPNDPIVEVGASFPRSIGIANTGDPVRGAEIARDGSVALRALPAASVTTHPALLLLAEASARCESGDLDEAERVGMAAYEQVLEQGIPQLHVWLSLMLGRIHLYRGHPAESRRWMAEGLTVATGIGFTPGRRIALTGLAVCAAQLGDAHLAATLLAELDGLPRDIGFLQPEVAFGRGWALAALGHTGRAIETLVAGADEAGASGETMLRHGLLYEAVRLGGDSSVRHALAEMTMTGPLALARRHYAAGVDAGSLELLEAAEAGFVACGADLSAAEAAAAIAAVHQRDGRPREAAAATARSVAAQQACGGARSPALATTAAVEGLTTRELETARLAATGLASKAIARELGVSVRTVSNHLQNAYVKLGITNRSDLATVLADLDR